jgi:hypothetical protein
MKASIEIPKGWRRLRKGERTQFNDMTLYLGHPCIWRHIHGSGYIAAWVDGPTIRRIKKRKGAK